MLNLLFILVVIKLYAHMNIYKRFTFKINTKHYLQLLAPETMKLLRRNKIKITANKNGDNVPHLEITELVLVQTNIANNDYQQDSRALYTIVPDKSFRQLLDIYPKILYF